MGIWYNGGSIAVESGSASVVGTDTLFNTKTKEGDTLYIPGGELYQLITITDDNNFTLDRVYAGTTDGTASYYILPTSPDWGEVSEVAHDLANFLANQATFFPTDGKPDDATGGDGSFAVDPNSTPPKLYVKTAGSWDDGTSLGGPMGATGAGYGGTSTDSKTLAATGSISWTTQSGLAWLVGNRIRAASASAPTTKWMEGVISSYSSTTLVVTIDSKGTGTGDVSDWNFGPAGQPGVKGDTGATGSTGSTGATGATGLGYGGTSTTSRLIASSGSMTWTIGTGKAYQVGDLVKIVSTADSTKWMKGVVSDYSAGVLTVTISESNGAGTIASWNIGLSGETGPQGSTGSTGAQGDVGPPYNPRGAYSSGTAYAQYDVVLDQGSSWVALGSTTGNDPPTLPTTSDDNWQLLAQKGTDGSGLGDFVGPSSSADGNIVIFDGMTGKAGTDSGITPSALIAAAVAAATAPRNRTINPCGLYAQVGFAAAADGTYSGFDQWYVLTQTGTVLCSQLTNVADGLPTMMRMTQSQATAQRMGWAQVFESGFVKDLRSKTVTLAAKVRMGASTTLRYAIVEWTGTVDTITKDVVADWTKTTFTVGQFFAASGLTIAATDSIALTSGTLTDISLSAAISSSMNNLIVFFWTDSTQAQTTTLDIGNVFFGQGESAPATFDPPSPIADLQACQRYYLASLGASSNIRFYSQVTSAANYQTAAMVFKVNMRVAPSMTLVDGGHNNFPATSGSAFSDQFSFIEVRAASGTGVGFFVSTWVADARL